MVSELSHTDREAVSAWHGVQADCPADAPVVIIDNVPAGSVLSDLGFFCLDEAQQPVHGGTLGKVQLSWSRGSKNVVLEEGIVCLPDMPVSLDAC